MAFAPRESDILDFYATRVRNLRASHATALKRWERFSNLRLVAFALLAITVWWAARNNEAHVIPALTVTLALAGFVGLVLYSSTAKARARRLADLVTTNEDAVLRIERNWPALEQPLWNPAPASHPYAVDLDVFGFASLVQLLPALSSAPGRTTVACWLLTPAPPSELRLRQQAIAELKPRLDWRDELVIRARRINIRVERLRALQRWATDDGWLIHSRWLIATTIMLPVAEALLAAAQATGLLRYPLWLIPLVLGMMLTVRFGDALKRTLSQVQGQPDTLERYADMASLVSAEMFHSTALQHVQHALSGLGGGAVRQIRTLKALADCSDLRLSPVLHFVVHTLTLWDFHVVHLLEKWQHSTGLRLGDWMTALGTVESLAALASLAHGNPEWTFPDVDECEPTLVNAAALGHPLLAASVRISNDVTVGPPGTILFVTGSNMAGKSTLLRAIGLNIVLAQAGSVVCASAMRFPPVALYTSMRVQDSLQRGVSYFMAELERLKLIVRCSRNRASNVGANTSVPLG